MQYRPFGKLDLQVSALGFGAMRLPVIDNGQSNIDAPLAMDMIRTAIDKGVNYVDTAYPYHQGQSEFLVGRALQEGYREKVKLATKLPTWLVQSLDDFDRFLNEQLTRLQTDHIDFYLLHGLNMQRWTKLREMNIFKPAEKAIADGRISYLGFSFHDDLEIFKKIIDCYDKWTFCQIQYNYMDTHYQAGTEGLRYADDKGIAVVVMEPIRGGQLAKQPPETVSQLWAKASIQRSPAEWALQWVWNQPEIALALSGMSTMQHVEENLASADRSGVGSLTDEELTLIKNVTEAYRELSPIPCTECGYCMPCPNGVNIPGVFALHNAAMIYKDVSKAQMLYQMQIPEENRADKCIACGDCLELCPQEIPIPEWLEKSNKLLRTQ